MKLQGTRELRAVPQPRAPSALTAATTPAAVVPTVPVEDAGGGGSFPASWTEGRAVVAVGLPAVAVIGLAWLWQRRRRFTQADPPIAGLADTDLEMPVTASQSAQLQAQAVPTFGTPARIKTMRLLLGLRSFAGAAALLSAIAFVVFWAIEFTDVGAGETGLNLPLLVCVLAGWALYWGAGRLANMLHRSIYNRNHPRFSD